MPTATRASPANAAASTASRSVGAMQPSLSAQTPATVAQLTLEDVARDAFRRKFFLDAFADEKEALELSFSFLQRIRQYKQLVGKREALQSIAEEVVAVYLRDPPPHLCVFLRSTAISTLLSRIFEAVVSQRSTPDLFSGMETHVNDRLEKEKFVAFLQTPQYSQLCDAIRKRRELPLGEILVDARRTHFLEQYLQYSNAAGLGNLRFWVEVQTVFLPLIQANVVSVALFEEIQATVRRLYNQFIVVSSPTAATAVPEALRSDILKRIMQLQGEPFSPARYATLFRQAQEKIWHWLQTIVYAKFQASMFYVALVVETENLESDRQLRKLSEHVQARVVTMAAPTGPAASVQATASQPKLSTVVIPVADCDQPRHSASESRFLRVVAPLLSSEAETTPIQWQKTLKPPAEFFKSGIHSVCVVRVTDVKTDGQLEIERELRVVETEGDEEIDLMDFLWNWREAIAIPGALSPSHRPQTSAPKPSFRSFSLPIKGDGRSTLYGYAVITWVASQRPSSFHEHGVERDSENETTDDFYGNRTGSGGLVGAIGRSTDHQHLLPRFTYVLAIMPQQRGRVLPVLLKLSDLSTQNVPESDLSSVLCCEHVPPTPRSVNLKPRYSGFYLHPQLPTVCLPVNWIFKELSHQTVVTLLGALLVGKSVIIVCPRPSALVLVATALVELLRPFEWRHLFLPLCPVRTACALADRTFFVSSSSSRSDMTQTQSPFIIGLEAELTHLKTKDSVNEPRHRIRNSIYSVQRVSLHLQPPRPQHPHATPCQDAESLAYPTEILHTNAVVLDVDADDVYIPDRVEIPEFPQGLVRNLETAVKDTMIGGGLTTADSRVFMSPSTEPAFLAAMLETSSSIDPEASIPPVDSVRCAVLSFLEALFGDVVFYFCSFRKSFAAPSAAATSSETVVLPVAADALATFVIFEADAFLDAKIEVGCRDFFRQVFQTELFHQFILRQHQRFGVH